MPFIYLAGAALGGALVTNAWDGKSNDDLARHAIGASLAGMALKKLNAEQAMALLKAAGGKVGGLLKGKSDS